MPILRSTINGLAVRSHTASYICRHRNTSRDQLPDVVVCWSDEARILALESDAVGTVSGASPDGRTGTHKPPGFVLARCVSDRTISIREQAHIFDFAPTLLASFGVDKPAAMEGRVWPMTKLT